MYSWMPVQLPASFQQLRAQCVVAPSAAQIPLPRGHDFQRAIPLLEVFDTMRNRPRWRRQIAAFDQHLDDPTTSLGNGAAAKTRIGLLCKRGFEPCRPLVLQTTVF